MGTLLGTAIGTWASVVSLHGAASGFVAMIVGRPRSEIIEEFQLGAVAGFIPGALLALASLFLV